MLVFFTFLTLRWKVWCLYRSQRHCCWGCNFHFKDCRSQNFHIAFFNQLLCKLLHVEICCKWWVLELVNAWIDASTCFSQRTNQATTWKHVYWHLSWMHDCYFQNLKQSCIDLQISQKKKKRKRRQTGVDLYALPRGMCYSHKNPTKCLPMLMSQLYQLPHNALQTI